MGLAQRTPQEEAIRQALPKITPSLHKSALVTVHRTPGVSSALTVTGRPLLNVKAVRFAEKLVPKYDLLHEIKTRKRTFPKIIVQARTREDADDWKAACKQQIRMYDHFGAFEYVDRDSLPVDALFTRPIDTWI